MLLRIVSVLDFDGFIGRECIFSSSYGYISINSVGVIPLQSPINSHLFSEHNKVYSKIYDVQDGKVVKSELVPTGDVSHAALVGFLAERGVDTLICDGLGEKAFRLLEEAGIKVYGGAKCDTDIAVQNLLDGKLTYDPNVYVGHKCGCHE